MTNQAATKTGPYAEVIGDPIAQSLSPLIHGHWLEALGIAADYRAKHVTPDQLQGYLEARKEDPNWRGCNVTLPHKLAILDHVADPGDVRSAIGAANTIFRLEDDGLGATNTDAGGFYTPLSATDLSGRHAIILGAGGAARAVLFALKQVDIGKVTLLARSPLKALGLLGQFGLSGDVLPMDAPLPAADLLVNASPLGMKGFDGNLDLDLSKLAPDSIVYDLVYNPLETPLLGAARQAQLETIDGLTMLIGQAAIAFELFFGQPVPDDAAIAQALRKKLLAALDQKS
ncbi:shikimate dehydrogenase [Parasphingorhabdus sp. DH2-15]|uniref:shikimate dehydrogenase n=1 Tax=Parasphingorhabdus sp. DH2-15 TaxID=3444112 RepID=UPI003F6893A8